jgi:MFS transporter, DHA1 family, tetracycline resistance protein
MSATSRKGALATVFLVVLIDLMGFGLVLPLLPFFAREFHASPVTVGFLFSSYSICQLICSPLWGSWSDRVGRRPVMLISTLGSTLSYVLFAASGSLELLFASRILAGVMGGNISAAQAYIADVTPPAERARGMGLIGAAFGIGFVIGPALATLLVHPSVRGSIESAVGNVSPAAFSWLQSHAFALPGFLGAILSATSFLLVIAKLPESRTPSSGVAAGLERASVFTARFWHDVAGAGLENPESYRRLLGCTFVLAFAHASMYSSFPLYCGQILGMTPQQVGTQYIVTGMIAVLIQGGMIRHLVKRFGERPLFLWGSVIMAGGFLLLPLAHSIPPLTFFLALTAFGNGLNGPTLNSLISQEAGTERVGATMGTAQGMSGLGRVIGPAWGGALYAMHAPLPFIVTGIVLAYAIVEGFRRHGAAAAD